MYLLHILNDVCIVTLCVMCVLCACSTNIVERSTRQHSFCCVVFLNHLKYLKMGLNKFTLFKTKCIRGYTYASVIRKNMKKNICARLYDDFDAEK